MEPFTATNCVRFGWELFKRRPWFLIGSFLLFYILTGVLGQILGEIAKLGFGLKVLTYVLQLGLWAIQGVCFTNFILKAHDDIEHVSLNDLWHPAPFWAYLGAMILYFLAIAVGVILLIVPGIIFSIMFGFYQYIVVDQNASPIEALKESKRITTGYKWELFMLGILSALLGLLGFLCLIVGVLVALPVTTLAIVHAYRLLHNKVLPTAVA